MHITFNAQTKPVDAVNAFYWSQAVPWCLTGFFGLLSFYQWLRSRQSVLKIKIASQRGQGDEAHKRFFVVDIVSFGADIYDATVSLEWTIGGKVSAEPMNVIGDVPNPLKLGHSRRFYLLNADPHSPTILESVPREDIAVVVTSGIREVKRINGKVFKTALDDVFKTDGALPRKPQPEPLQQSEWLRGTSKW